MNFEYIHKTKVVHLLTYIHPSNSRGLVSNAKNFHPSWHKLCRLFVNNIEVAQQQLHENEMVATRSTGPLECLKFWWRQKVIKGTSFDEQLFSCMPGKTWLVKPYYSEKLKIWDQRAQYTTAQTAMLFTINIRASTLYFRQERCP